MPLRLLATATAAIASLALHGCSTPDTGHAGILAEAGGETVDRASVGQNQERAPAAATSTSNAGAHGAPGVSGATASPASAVPGNTASVSALSSLVLVPFGPVSKLLKEKSPWRGFSASDPVLFVARAQRLGPNEVGSCDRWVTALRGSSSGYVLPPARTPATWANAWREWDPWTEDDLDYVRDCDSLPCKVKLNAAEVAAMRRTPEAQRKDRFLSLVIGRVEGYVGTGERKEYEFPGNPADPWSSFAKKGFLASLAMPRDPTLLVRRLDLAPGDMKPLRQVLDRRFAVGPLAGPSPAVGSKGASAPIEATVWLRDAYTSHYFDSWGEWFDFRCDPVKREAVVVQALLVEFDLLKKSDLLSVLSRGRMRSGVSENGARYLDLIFKTTARKAAMVKED